MIGGDCVPQEAKENFSLKSIKRLKIVVKVLINQNNANMHCKALQHPLWARSLQEKNSISK